MRAKIQIGSVIPNNDPDGKLNNEQLHFHGVCASKYPEDGRDENNTFARFSPSVSLDITIANPYLFGQFAKGDQFYVDFIRVPEILKPIESPASVPGQPPLPVNDGLDVSLQETARQMQVLEDKALRQNLDAIVEHLKKSPLRSAERTLALRKIQSARHWLGEDLGNLREPYPYPNGADATVLTVDPATDRTTGNGVSL